MDTCDKYRYIGDKYMVVNEQCKGHFKLEYRWNVGKSCTNNIPV